MHRLNQVCMRFVPQQRSQLTAAMQAEPRRPTAECLLCQSALPAIGPAWAIQLRSLMQATLHHDRHCPRSDCCCIPLQIAKLQAMCAAWKSAAAVSSGAYAGSRSATLRSTQPSRATGPSASTRTSPPCWTMASLPSSTQVSTLLPPSANSRTGSWCPLAPLPSPSQPCLWTVVHHVSLWRTAATRPSQADNGKCQSHHRPCCGPARLHPLCCIAPPEATTAQPAQLQEAELALSAWHQATLAAKLPSLHEPAAGTEDLICNWLGNKRWVDVLPWSGAAGWLTAPEDDFTVDAKTVGSVRSFGGLSFVKVGPFLSSCCRCCCLKQPCCCTAKHGRTASGRDAPQACSRCMLLS